MVKKLSDMSSSSDSVLVACFLATDCGIRGIFLLTDEHSTGLVESFLGSSKGEFLGGGSLENNFDCPAWITALFLCVVFFSSSFSS